MIDHFKRVDERTLMYSNGKTSLVRDRHFYFYLQRDDADACRRRLTRHGDRELEDARQNDAHRGHSRACR